MKQSENRVDIRGKIKEIDLTENVEKGFVRGKIIMVVPQSIEGMAEVEEIEINAFANKITKAQKENVQYSQLMTLMKEGKSIMAVGEENASVYDVNGILDENMFPDRNGKDVTYTFVRGSFFNPTRPNFKDDAYARFKQEILIVDMQDEMVDDVLTGRLLIKAAVMNYGGPCSFTYIVESKPAIEFIKSNWNVNDTVLVQGLIRSKAETVEAKETEASLGFGTSFNNSYVKTVKEYVITAGSEAYPDDRAFIPSEVFSAREEKLKKYQEAKEAKKSTPTAAPLHQAMGFAGISRGF